MTSVLIRDLCPTTTQYSTVDHMSFQLIPDEFFVTSGSAVSPISDLNAFDLALHRAGVAEQNMVAVSSVIPPQAKMVPYRELPMGMVTHCVLAQMRGRDGDRIASGIAYAFRKDGYGGYVAEGHMFGDKEALDEELRRKIKEMERMRGIEFEEPVILSEELKIPEGEYGCTIVSLVFCGYRD